MLEGIIANVLNRVLGDFIDGIDAKQLNISLVSGDVELFNLSIKPSILDKLPLPFKLKYGKVGRIFVDVPVVSFLTSPIKIEVSEIFMMISPKEVGDWDEEVIKKAFLNTTKSSLENLEEFYKGQLELQSQGPGVGANVVNSIIDNLRIEVRNVYIRFEDEISYPRRPFCVGICLEALEVFTCTDRWARRAVANSDISMKIVKLTNFQMYLNYADVNKAAKDDIVLYDKITHDLDIEDIEDDEIRKIIEERQEKGVKAKPGIVRWK